ncbi:MAG: DNA polymerase III subunit delta [Robiginitomaculum sp.]|nr:MAG: DNA polymerase III subunit delta [Robiginitomaculum sp.]
MKLSGAAINRFIKNPDPAIHIILLYGPDHGLVAERAEALEAIYLGDDAGPFSQTGLNQSDTKSDPAILQDSICAMALGGGKRVVRLKTSADQSAKTVKDLLAALHANEIRPAALLLIEAGDLSPRSTLRKSIEQDKALAITIPCYAPGLADLREQAVEIAKKFRLRYDDGALDHLLGRLPQDRALADSELNKLTLYAAKNEDGLIRVEDVMAIITDTQAQNLDAFTYAVADGDTIRADQHLIRATEAGQSPIALLRALQRHFLRLSEAKTATDAGRDIKSAMASLRPPVFFMFQSRFSRQLGRWSTPALVRVLEHGLATEQAMKRSGALPHNLLARLVIKICAGKP